MEGIGGGARVSLTMCVNIQALHMARELPLLTNSQPRRWDDGALLLGPEVHCEPERHARHCWRPERSVDAAEQPDAVQAEGGDDVDLGRLGCDVLGLGGQQPPSVAGRHFRRKVLGSARERQEPAMRWSRLAFFGGFRWHSDLERVLALLDVRFESRRALARGSLVSRFSRERASAGFSVSLLKPS